MSDIHSCASHTLCRYKNSCNLINVAIPYYIKDGRKVSCTTVCHMVHFSENHLSRWHRQLELFPFRVLRYSILLSALHSTGRPLQSQGKFFSFHMTLHYLWFLCFVQLEGDMTRDPTTPTGGMIDTRPAQAPGLGPLFYSSEKDEIKSLLQSTLLLHGGSKDRKLSACWSGFILTSCRICVFN